MFATPGWLFVGDGKISALNTRAHLHHLGLYYLSPLAMTDNTPSEMAQWVQMALGDEQAWQQVFERL